jgi:D-cysteine desulfhydrase
MAAEHPRAEPASWPTPIEPAPRLAAALGLEPGDLWIKRDDLSGLGGGGNKVRKLEWLCGAALAATVVWAGDADLAGRVDEVASELRLRGAVPAVLPFGGSSPLGARGYEICGEELTAQAPDLAQVVVALGSGGTMAGLVRSLGAGRVLGMHVGAVPDPAAVVAGLLGRPPPELRIRLDQVGDGYPDLTPAAWDAMATAARAEGLVLDPIYTGRAMAGLAAAVGDGSVVPGERTVFLHSGGLPGLFGHPDTVRRGAGAVR